MYNVRNTVCFFVVAKNSNGGSSDFRFNTHNVAKYIRRERASYVRT